jgi:O-antigen/teichoic acid export membrane protein
LLSISAIFIICNNLLVFNLAVLAGMGKIKERVKILAISTILTVITSILSIPLIWMYWAIAWFCMGQLSLFILSYTIVHKHIKINIDWHFVIKNIIFIGILWGIIRYIKPMIFIFDDGMRYNNLWKLALIWTSFYILFGIFNRRKVVMLKKEIWKLKK